MFLHVATVGTGEDVKRSVLYTIKKTNPRYVLLLVTPDARNRALEIQNELTHLGIPFESVECQTTDEVNTLYGCYRRAISNVMERLNVQPKDVSVDFTRGTKVMSAVIVYVAIELDIGTLYYVDGWDKDKKTGKVIPGTEKLITFEPAVLFFQRDLNILIRYFNTSRFQQGLELIDQLKEHYQYPKHIKVLEILEAFFKSYGAWDRFELKSAKEAFRHLVQTLKNNKGLPEQLIEQVRIHSTFVHQLSQNPWDKLWPAVFVTTAERWVLAGRIDFAVALLYRMIEYLAHARLQERGLNPSGIPLEELSETLREKYRPYAEEGKLRLGLRRSYELLADLGDEYARKFLEAYLDMNHPLRRALDRRNMSVLAHGTQPVDRKVYEYLYQWAEASLKEILGKKFNESIEQIRFPVLKTDWFLEG